MNKTQWHQTNDHRKTTQGYMDNVAMNSSKKQDDLQYVKFFLAEAQLDTAGEKSHDTESKDSHQNAINNLNVL